MRTKKVERTEHSLCFVKASGLLQVLFVCVCAHLDLWRSVCGHIRETHKTQPSLPVANHVRTVFKTNENGKIRAEIIWQPGHFILNQKRCVCVFATNKNVAICFI